MNENYAFDTAGDFWRHITGQTDLGGPTKSAYWQRLLQTPSMAAQRQAAGAPQMGIDQDLNPDAYAAMLASMRATPEPTVQDLPTGQDLDQPPTPVAAAPERGGLAEDLAAGGEREMGPRGSTLTSAAAGARQAAAAPRQGTPPPVAPSTPSGGNSFANVSSDRPMTSRGPALGPYPQGMPHSQFRASPDPTNPVLRAAAPTGTSPAQAGSPPGGAMSAGSREAEMARNGMPSQSGAMSGMFSTILSALTNMIMQRQQPNYGPATDNPKTPNRIPDMEMADMLFNTPMGRNHFLNRVMDPNTGVGTPAATPTSNWYGR